VEHSVDRAGRRRDRKFKPPVFGQIQAAGDNGISAEFAASSGVCGAVGGIGVSSWKCGLSGTTVGFLTDRTLFFAAGAVLNRRGGKS
jgi:hypothetical protein